MGGRLALWTRRRPLAALLLLVCLLAPIGLLIAYSVGAGDASSAKAEVDNANRAAAAAAARTAGVQRDVAETRKREQRATYLHYILLADRELREGEAERARQLLADCPADQRDWEWRYLNYRTNLFNQPEYLNFEASAGPVSDFAFSPDGRWLAAASGGANPEVVLWQPPSTEAAHVLTGFARRSARSPSARTAGAWRSPAPPIATSADWTGDVSGMESGGERATSAASPRARRGLAAGRWPTAPTAKRLLVVDDHGHVARFCRRQPGRNASRDRHGGRLELSRLPYGRTQLGGHEGGGHRRLRPGRADLRPPARRGRDAGRAAPKRRYGAGVQPGNEPAGVGLPRRQGDRLGRAGQPAGRHAPGPRRGGHERLVHARRPSAGHGGRRRPRVGSGTPRRARRSTS